ncbi:MAG: hypothetical protein KAQ62_13185, partial [Cyclobacteriaceae bacterium]|nr:hypothetical protein [Cyclobacteriaceae bacterium]
MSNKTYSLRFLLSISLALLILVQCSPKSENNDNSFVLSKEVLQDKIKGAWAAQTIGVTYGGPTEFKYNKRIIPD